MRKIQCVANETVLHGETIAKLRCRECGIPDLTPEVLFKTFECRLKSLLAKAVGGEQKIGQDESDRP